MQKQPNLERTLLHRKIHKNTQRNKYHIGMLFPVGKETKNGEKITLQQNKHSF